MKTFGDLKEGDTVYAIFPEYDNDGSWCYTIDDFKIIEWLDWIPYTDGVANLIIKLDNGFYFKPDSNQAFHLGSDNEGGAGKTYNFNVEYFTDINNIKLIENYEFVIKDIEETLKEKYNIIVWKTRKII